MMPKTSPSFEIEESFWSQGLTVAGADEVGRGAFAGPVVAAAVIFPPYFTSQNFLFKKINDSKLLNPKLRVKLAEFIKKHALCAIAEVSVGGINSYGIGKATRLAIVNASQRLSRKPQVCLIDGRALKKFPFTQHAIIRGDRISISIAAASIIAKVHRDELMQNLHVKYRQYDFLNNKGYGTIFHRKMINKHGLCPLHRTSFALSKYLRTT